MMGRGLDGVRRSPRIIIAAAFSASVLAMLSAVAVGLERWVIWPRLVVHAAAATMLISAIAQAVSGRQLLGNNQELRRSLTALQWFAYALAGGGLVMQAVLPLHK
jgi:hypothetical protein